MALSELMYGCKNLEGRDEHIGFSLCVYIAWPATGKEMRGELNR